MRIEIKRIHTEFGLITVYVTHDQAEAMSLSDKVVVMRQRRIEQVGTPQEIYNRPNNLYVAGFMGYANRLSGAIVGRDGDCWLVETDEGLQLRGTVPTEESSTWQLGRCVTLCFKAEETLADPLPTVNQMRGRVQLVEYIGKAFEVVVRLEGEQGIQLLAQSHHLPEMGSELAFGVRPERLLVFASDGQSGTGGLAPDASSAQPTIEAAR